MDRIHHQQDGLPLEEGLVAHRYHGSQRSGVDLAQYLTGTTPSLQTQLANPAHTTLLVKRLLQDLLQRPNGDIAWKGRCQHRAGQSLTRHRDRVTTFALSWHR